MRHALILVLAAWLTGGSAGSGTPADLVLEIRVFDRQQEVTGESRVTIYRAGERTEPVARFPEGTAGIALPVPEGQYDVQAILAREGQVVGVRWAERLLVVPYAEERGRHLEVVNYRTGFGALQVRASDGGPVPRLALYPAGQRDQEAATPLGDGTYTLFVVPVGKYDLRIRDGDREAWHTDIEVPEDRTRPWTVP